MHPRATLAPLLALMAGTLLATACRDAVSPAPDAPDADAGERVVLGPGDGTLRITGLGSAGPGSATPGGDRRDLDFDVASDLTGRAFFRDWSVIRPDGSTGTLTVSPTDAATAITAFRDGSSACSDPSRGVEFEGIGRVNTAGDSNPAGDELLAFTVSACDNGPAESDLDFIRIFIPARPFERAEFLSSGDIVKSGSPAALPGTGDLTIATSTTGSGVPAGYTLNASGPGGSVSQPIGANATVSFPGITSGDYTASLSDVPANCTVSGANPRTVTVPAGGTGRTTFSVSCTGTAPGPSGTGDLTIVTSTTGSGIPAGYTLTASGPAGSVSQPIGANATVSFPGITSGDYTASLRDVPANCTVSGANPRTVTVPAGSTGSTTFSVSCTASNQAPVVNAGPDDSVLLGLFYTLNASFSDPDNGPWSYTIHWGDGTSTSGTKTSQGTISAGHTYLLGTFTIRVTVTDSRGASGSDTKVLKVLTGLGGIL